MAAPDAPLPPIEVAKHISVYQNGDEKNAGKRIILNKRKIANFDCFLDHVTETLRPRFGAVRRLYTPVGGHRITDLEQVILRGENYVAAGQERFQRIGYLEIEVCPRKRPNRNSIEIKPVQHSRIQTSGRIRKIRTDPIIFFVHPNGNDLEGPHRIHLCPREQGSWNMVLDAVKDRVTLRWGGAIRRLCNLEGHPIKSVHEIENSGCYVACGAERFVHKDYEHPKLVMHSPRQERRLFQHGLKLTPLNQSQRTSKKGSQNSSVNRTPDSHNGDTNSRPRKARRKQVKKEDPVIYEKPVAYKRNGEKKKEVNYDQDPGGVFKSQAENQATKGAAEITEDRETRVDVPVDQRKAEVVEDEEIEIEQPSKPASGKSSERSRRVTPHHHVSQLPVQISPVEPDRSSEPDSGIGFTNTDDTDGGSHKSNNESRDDNEERDSKESVLSKDWDSSTRISHEDDNKLIQSHGEEDSRERCKSNDSETIQTSAQTEKRSRANTSTIRHKDTRRASQSDAGSERRESIIDPQDFDGYKEQFNKERKLSRRNAVYVEDDLLNRASKTDKARNTSRRGSQVEETSNLKGSRTNEPNVSSRRMSQVENSPEELLDRKESEIGELRGDTFISNREVSVTEEDDDDEPPPRRSSQSSGLSRSLKEKIRRSSLRSSQEEQPTTQNQSDERSMKGDHSQSEESVHENNSVMKREESIVEDQDADKKTEATPPPSRKVPSPLVTPEPTSTNDTEELARGDNTAQRSPSPVPVEEVRMSTPDEEVKGQPVIETTEDQSVTETTEDQPVTETTEDQPVTETTEDQPVTETTEDQPVTETVEDQPVTETTEDQPVTETTEDQPSSVVPEDKAATEEEANKEEKSQQKAAITIQSGYRGYRVRRDQQQLKNSKKSTLNQDEAATVIQSRYRGYKTRQQLKNSEKSTLNQDEAATVIQSRYRGYKTRQQLKLGQ